MSLSIILVRTFISSVCYIRNDSTLRQKLPVLIKTINKEYACTMLINIKHCIVTLYRTSTYRAWLARTGVGGVLVGSRNTFKKKNFLGFLTPFLLCLSESKYDLHFLSINPCTAQHWFTTTLTLIAISVTTYGLCNFFAKFLK
jgi:hypothetical protein